MAAKTQYSLFFSYGGSTVRLPVNPEEYTIGSTSDNSRYHVLDIGEVVVPSGAGPRSISWESFFPGDPSEPYVLTAGSFKAPSYYISLLQGYQNKKKKVRFIANRCLEDGTSLQDTNIKVIVESFEVTEKGGETGDFYYKITLTEYRSFSPQVVEIIDKGGDEAGAASTPQREEPDGEISVGTSVVASGKYYYSSYGDSPTGTANSLKTTVTRIVGSPASGQGYPYHIGQYGWLKKSQLRKA